MEIITVLLVGLKYICFLIQIHFHFADDWDKVYEVLPRNCLPSDFGGELETCEELHSTWFFFIYLPNNYSPLFLHFEVGIGKTAISWINLFSFEFSKIPEEYVQWMDQLKKFFEDDEKKYVLVETKKKNTIKSAQVDFQNLSID